MNGSALQASDRWANVERSVNGIADYGIAKAIRAYYLVYMPVGAVFLIAAVAFLPVPHFGLSPDDF